MVRVEASSSTAAMDTRSMGISSNRIERREAGAVEPTISVCCAVRLIGSNSSLQSEDAQPMAGGQASGQTGGRAGRRAGERAGGRASGQAGGRASGQAGGEERTDEASAGQESKMDGFSRALLWSKGCVCVCWYG
jgi:hypothetical protein